MAIINIFSTCTSYCTSISSAWLSIRQCKVRALPQDIIVIGYEPADLIVHPPPPEKLSRVGSFFSCRCLVFPKKCPQRKVCTFLSYYVKRPKNVFLSIFTQTKF